MAELVSLGHGHRRLGRLLRVIVVAIVGSLAFLLVDNWTLIRNQCRAQWNWWQFDRAQRRCIAASARVGDVLFCSDLSLLNPGDRTSFIDAWANKQAGVIYCGGGWVRPLPPMADYLGRYQTLMSIPNAMHRYVPLNSDDVVDLSEEKSSDGTTWLREIGLASPFGESTIGINISYYLPPTSGSVLAFALPPPPLHGDAISWLPQAGPMLVQRGKCHDPLAVFALDFTQSGHRSHIEVIRDRKTYRLTCDGIVQDALQPVVIPPIPTMAYACSAAVLHRLQNFSPSDCPVQRIMGVGSDAIVGLDIESNGDTTFIVRSIDLNTGAKRSQCSLPTEVNAGFYYALQANVLAFIWPDHGIVILHPGNDTQMPADFFRFQVAGHCEFAISPDAERMIFYPSEYMTGTVDCYGNDGQLLWSNGPYTGCAVELGCQKVLVTENGVTNVLDANTGIRLSRVHLPIHSLWTALSPDDTLVATPDSVIEVATGKLIACSTAPAEAVCFSPDGRWAACYDKALTVIDLTDRAKPEMLMLPESLEAASAAFTRDSKRLVVLYDQGKSLGVIDLAELERGKP